MGSESKRDNILNLLKPESNDDIQNDIIKDFSNIASIIGLPPNTSKEDKKKLLSKIERLQDPDISLEEKAILIDEILQLKGNLSDSQKEEIISALKPEYGSETENKII